MLFLFYKTLDILVLAALEADSLSLCDTRAIVLISV